VGAEAHQQELIITVLPAVLEAAAGGVAVEPAVLADRDMREEMVPALALTNMALAVEAELRSQERVAR